MNRSKLNVTGIIAVVFSMLLSSAGMAAEPIKDFGAIGLAKGVQRPGAVVWMDLLTSDVDKAAEFYSELFGWQFQFSPDRSYAYATAQDHPVASIAAYDEKIGEAEGLWIPSLSVLDVDAAVAAVKAHRGTIIEPPEELPGRGRYLLIEDPAGAAVMLLQASGGDPERMKAKNQWLWAELWIDDVKAVTGFYEKVVGYRTISVKDAEGQDFMLMGRDKQPHASVVRTPLPDVEPAWLAYLRVENVDVTVRAVLKAGGSILLAPQKDGFNDDIAIVADPTGGVFALQQKEAE